MINNAIEQLYNKFQQEKDVRTICDRSRVELTENNLQIVVSGRFKSVLVSIKRKCKFSGLFIEENEFVWHTNSQSDIDNLIGRINKVRSSTISNGPFDFSRRSTFIKRLNNTPVAKSGNFVGQAKCVGVVSVLGNGALSNDVSSPDCDPWFMVECTHALSSSFKIIYNMDSWWPVNVSRNGTCATSVLHRTNGRLLTMHDKFVIDLSVKIYSEDNDEYEKIKNGRSRK